MDNYAKRLFADFRRLAERVKHLEDFLSVEAGLSLKQDLLESSESNHPGGAGAGTNAAQATASPGCNL